MEVDETEFMSGTVPELVRAITACEVAPGPDGHRTFESTSPDWWGGNRTFGGMVVAQALHAACRTVPEEFEVHSLHGYFLRPSRPGSTSVHRVDPVRDGRSFSLREVSTEGEGRTTFRMTCSFHRPEAGDEYQLPIAADVSPPEPDIEGVEGGERGDEGDAGVSFPFDIRELGATVQRDDGTYQSTRRCWFRTRERLPDDPFLHACILAYLSDMTGASFRPGSLATWGTHTDASLDHAVWFHRPRRADEWNLFDLQALVNAGGRATVRGTMHGADGALYLSMAQELLIRELEVPLEFAVPPWAEKSARRPARAEVNEKEGQHGTA